MHWGQTWTVIPTHLSAVILNIAIWRTFCTFCENKSLRRSFQEVGNFLFKVCFWTLLYETGQPFAHINRRQCRLFHLPFDDFFFFRNCNPSVSCKSQIGTFWNFAPKYSARLGLALIENNVKCQNKKVVKTSSVTIWHEFKEICEDGIIVKNRENAQYLKTKYYIHNTFSTYWSLFVVCFWYFEAGHLTNFYVFFSCGAKQLRKNIVKTHGQPSRYYIFFRWSHLAFI